MIKQKKFKQEQQEQEHYHLHDEFDHLLLSSTSSWYFQLRNNSNRLTTMRKSKETTLFDSITLRFYVAVFLFVFLVFFISFFILFPSSNQDQTLGNHRLKRQISALSLPPYGKKHYKNMLRRILSHRNSSNVLADCSINTGSDGIYRLPPQDSLASEIISLIEKSFQNEFQSLERTVNKIRTKLNESKNYLGDFALAKFYDEFSISLRVLLANQASIKEIHIMIAPPIPNENNGGAYIYYDTIKYYRLSNESTAKNQLDYDSIHDIKLKQNVNIILQTFTASNARETLRLGLNNHYLLMKDGWWIGPVLCEKNKNETFIMAHIFPLTDSYFLVSYFNISSIDINQCTDQESPFGGTHECPTNMECIHRAGYGFRLGSYICRCSLAQDQSNYTIDGEELESNELIEENSNALSHSLCQCNDDSCRVSYKKILRTMIIVIQSIFIVFVAILAAIIFKRRKTKIIKHSMWILLELVLLGAALLYASVIVDSFGPHGVVCLVMPWLRELGFTIVYGTLILRIYKMLAEFQSRKAHCVQVKEKDMLRILFFMTISITGYLLGWTLVNIDHSNENITLSKYLLGDGKTDKESLHFKTCRPRSWDYLVQFAEFVFLCVGIRFIYSTRTAPCEYHERKLITVAVVCEMLFSTLLHIIRDCLWSSIHPDGLFILSVFRCHFTVTGVLILIFCTKLCYIFRPFNEEYSGRDRFRSLPDGVEPNDLVAKLQTNGDIEFGELNIRDMDPEEIRTELKRLYTSLHVLKTKTMRKDNPHLTKRHGQRRKNRRFSMQPFQRHGGPNPITTNTGVAVSHVLTGVSGDKHEHEATKTPEDSTGSHNEPTHIGGPVTHRTSLDESDDAHGRTLSDLTMTMASSSAAAAQRVTFK